MALDGPLAVDVGSPRQLLATSLSQAMVKSDDQGQCPTGEEGKQQHQLETMLLKGLVLAAGCAGPKA